MTQWCSSRAEILQSTAAAPELWAGVPWAPFPLEPSLGDGYALVTRASVWILEVGSVLGFHSLDVLHVTSEPKDKYLSKTEVYIKYVHYKGPDWFCCIFISLQIYSGLWNVSVSNRTKYWLLNVKQSLVTLKFKNLCTLCLLVLIFFTL